MSECTLYEDVYGLIQSSGEPAWNGGAVFSTAMSGDGYYSLQVARSATGIVVGLASDPTGEDYSRIQHGLYFGHGTVRVIENQVVRASRYYADDSTLHIVRRSNVVYYCFGTERDPDTGLPGTPFYTSQFPSFGLVYLDASFYNEGDTILSAAFTPGNGESGYASGQFVFSGACSDDAYAQATGDLTFSGLASGGMRQGALGSLRLLGLSYAGTYQYAMGDFGLRGVCAAGIVPDYGSLVGLFELVGAVHGSRVIPQGSDGYFQLPGRATVGDHDQDRVIDIGDLPVDDDGHVIAEPGDTVVIVIGDDTFTHVVQPGDTLEDIANDLAEQIDTHPDYSAHVETTPTGEVKIVIADGAGVAEIVVETTFPVPVSRKPIISGASIGGWDAAGSFALTGYASGQRTALQNYFDVSLRLRGANDEPLVVQDILRCQDRLALWSDLTLVEQADLRTLLRAGTDASFSAQERLSLLDKLYAAIPLNLRATFDIVTEPELTFRAILMLSEFLAAVETQTTRFQAAVTLTEAVVLQEVWRSIADLTATEALTLADEMTQAIHAELRTEEAMALADELSCSLLLLFDDHLNLTSQGGASVASLLNLSGAVGLIPRLRLPRSS